MNIFNAKNLTKSVSVTDVASAAVAIPILDRQLTPSGETTIRIVNVGDKCFVAIGDSSVAATVPFASDTDTCTPIAAGSDNIFSVTINTKNTHISAVCDTGESATIYVSGGRGA